MKHILITILLFITISAFCQQKAIKEIIAVTNKTDTLNDKQFDSINHLVFEKFYPDNLGIAQVLAYSYHGDKLTRSVWLHSNAGFIIDDYEYDSIHNSMKKYRYESKDDFNNGISYTSSIYNIEDLYKSLKFKEVINQKPYLYEISYFKDTLLMKTIIFNKNGDTSNVTKFIYDKNLLVFENQILRDGDSSKIFYTYDSIGRELSWEKCSMKKTCFKFKYNYEIPEVVKIIEFDVQKIRSTEINRYKENKLVEQMYYYGDDTKAERVIHYKYNNKNNLIFKLDSNYLNTGKTFKIRYLYK